MKLNERYNIFEVYEAIDKAGGTYRQVFDLMKKEGTHKRFFKTFEFDGIICPDPNATVIFTRAVDGKRFEGEVKLSHAFGGKVSPCWVQQATYTAYANMDFTRFTIYNERGGLDFKIDYKKMLDNQA